MNLVKNLTHPRNSVYKLYAAAGRPLPVPLARLLSVGNRTVTPGAVDVPTYDGSGQGLFMLQAKSASPPQSRLALFSWVPEERLWRWERDPDICILCDYAEDTPQEERAFSIT